MIQHYAALCRLPDTTEGNSIRHILWSLWNQHHKCNLWEHLSNLSPQSRSGLGPLITGNIAQREAVIRQIFTTAEEFERLDTHPLT